MIETVGSAWVVRYDRWFPPLLGDLDAFDSCQNFKQKLHLVCADWTDC